MSEQTYAGVRELARIREGKCPECGRGPEAHTGDNRFWMPGNQACGLLERGVRARIAWQLKIDEDTAAVDHEHVWNSGWPIANCTVGDCAWRLQLNGRNYRLIHPEGY